MNTLLFSLFLCIHKAEIESVIASVRFVVVVVVLKNDANKIKLDHPGSVLISTESISRVMW